KARFVKEVMGLANLELFEDDVRNLSEEKYGRFDVVLCCGLLYHLDAPDLFEFMEKVSSVCDRVLLLDTHFSLRPAEAVGYKGKTYHGWRYTEFPPAATREEKDASPLASLDNNESFWLTRPSLWNLIKDVGFTTAYLCVNPAADSAFSDREVLIALKGRPQTIVATPLVNEFPPTEWPEQDGRQPQAAQAAALRAAEPPPPRPGVLTRAARKLGRALRAKLT
ncbi:MAG TPA: class I SAM-dependent methyltransferase, partial [Pyrinomonadaceae bacterium]|nr:class I SAM-dependent methyltransferase [Pyrinomonadaceae bacterium]